MTDDPQRTDDAPNPEPEPPTSGQQRSARHRTEPEPRAAGRAGVFAAAVQDIQRMREIGSVLARHGFHRVIQRTGLEKVLGDRFSPPPDAQPIDPTDRRGTARQLRLVFEELGATFIKLGQILSTRPDLLPQAYIEEFERLQDGVPPMGFDQVRAQVEQALGASLEDLYTDFDPEPLATASIGQVHTAVAVGSGRKVVVKVQRVGIQEQIRSDLDILYFMARILEATVEESDIYNVGEIVREFDRAISQEIDFLNEARNLERFAANCADNPHVVIPDVIEELSCQTVLTLEFLEGVKLSDVEPGSAQAERLIEILFETAYNQVFVHGLFHGDPHPGNILVLGPEKIALIDLGLVGHLSRTQQDDLVTLLLTILGGDIDGIARAVLRMGRPQGRVNLAEFKREIAAKRERYLNRSLEEIDVSAFTMDLMDAALRYRIKLNSEYSLLAKAAMTIEGILRKLHPELDLAQAAAPFARRLVMERYNSRRLLQTLLTGAVNLSSFLREVPAQLDQVLMDIESGTATVNIRNPQMDQLGSHLSELATRIFLGLLCCGMLVGGSIMVAQIDEQIHNTALLSLMAAIMFIATGTIAFWTLAWPVIRPRLGRVRLMPILSLWRRIRGQ